MKRILLLSFLFLSLSAAAQQQKDSFWKDLNDFLNMREAKGYAKMDTTYIGRYPYHWDARLFYTSTGLRIDNVSDGRISLGTGMNHRVGVGLSYRGLGLSYSRAIGKKLNFNFTVDSYSKHLGIEYALRFTTGLKGTFDTPTELKPDLNSVLLGESRLNLFWSFNPRFSYAAAMKQSKIQRRSAGSFIAAASWSVWDVVSFKDGGEIAVNANQAAFKDKDLTQTLLFELLASNMFYNRVSVGAGYGYNWVLRNQHWLLHASAVPMWSVYEATTIRREGVKVHTPYPNGWIAVSFTGRAGAYYRWADHWSVGLSGVINQMASRNFLNRSSQGFHLFSAHDWQFRLSLAYRFGTR